MNQKQSLPTEQIREFVIAGHGNLERVKAMLAETPILLNTPYEWGPGDTETAIQGAAHVGNAAIATYLLSQGAPLELNTAAMLGDREAVEQFLTVEPACIHSKGAHGIPLLAHAVFSGDVVLVESLVERGATAGMSAALSNAVSMGHSDVVRWLLEHGDPDLHWENFQGKRALQIAVERGYEEIVSLLQEKANSLKH